MTNVSAQEFRNSYEKFYSEMRKYLWPFDVLTQLGELEVEIYSAFFDINKIVALLNKLYSSIKDTFEDDEAFEKAYNQLKKLADIQDANVYHRLNQVAETNPEKDKQLKTLSNEEDNNIED